MVGCSSFFFRLVVWVAFWVDRSTRQSKEPTADSQPTPTRSNPQVEGMQAELVTLQPRLTRMVAEVEGLMARIAHDKKEEVRLGGFWGTGVSSIRVP
jgi:hypothetical protein